MWIGWYYRNHNKAPVNLWVSGTITRAHICLENELQIQNSIQNVRIVIHLRWFILHWNSFVLVFYFYFFTDRVGYSSFFLIDTGTRTWNSIPAPNIRTQVRTSRFRHFVIHFELSTHHTSSVPPPPLPKPFLQPPASVSVCHQGVVWSQCWASTHHTFSFSLSFSLWRILYSLTRTRSHVLNFGTDWLNVKRYLQHWVATLKSRRKRSVSNSNYSYVNVTLDLSSAFVELLLV